MHDLLRHRRVVELGCHLVALMNVAAVIGQEPRPDFSSKQRLGMS